MLGFGKRVKTGLVDPTGRNISSGESPKILGLDGKPIAVESEPLPTLPVPESRGKKGDRVRILGLVVSAQCSDGFFRQIILKPREGRKLFKFLARLQPKGLNLQVEPSFMIIRKSQTTVLSKSATPNGQSEPDAQKDDAAAEKGAVAKS